MCDLPLRCVEFNLVKGDANLICVADREKFRNSIVTKSQSSKSYFSHIQCYKTYQPLPTLTVLLSGNSEML